ncbi:MAG: DUF4129 domain-containing protein [Deltaproteobacteria bacterium]|nr:DUF4129 domain-containing protein [Deltaproteobacteria bacterium]
MNPRALGWFAAAAVGVALPAWALEPPDPGQTIRALTERNDYWLCGRSRGAADGQLRWCAIAGRAEHCRAWTANCPAAAAKGAIPYAAAGKAGALQGGDVEGGGKRTTADRSPEDDESGAGWSVAWLRDALIGAVLALVGWIAWQIWRGRKGAPLAAQEPGDAAARPAVETQWLSDPARLPEVAAALASARALAATQPGPALAWLYAAALRHLHDDGALRWHPALGNREALRSLAASHPLGGPMRNLVAQLEGWRFGGRIPNRADVDRALDTLAPLLRSTASLALALCVVACGSGDTTVSGRALTWDLLRAQGWSLAAHRLSVREIDANSPTVWVDAEHSTVLPSMLAELGEAACRGGRVVLFASHGQGLAPLHAAVVDLSAPATRFGDFGPMTPSRAPPGRQVVLPLRLIVSDTPTMAAALRDELAGVLPELAQQPPPAATESPRLGCALRRESSPLLWIDDQPAALRWTAPAGGSLTVVADNDLLANAAMSVPDNARAVVALARDTAPQRELALLVPQAAQGAVDASDAVRSAGLVPLLAQGTLVLLVAAWMRGARFGAPLSQQRDRRRAFTDHVAALAQLLRARRATHWPAAQVCALALDRLQRRLGPTDLATLADRVAATQPGTDARSVRRLVEKAEALRTSPSGPDHPEDVRTARDLDLLVANLDRRAPPRPNKGEK